MHKVIKSIEKKYFIPALELVERVFAEHENGQAGKLVRSLAEEIRSKRFSVPALKASSRCD